MSSAGGGRMQGTLFQVTPEGQQVILHMEVIPMNILQALLGEHGVFYAQFTHLEQQLPGMEDLDTVQELGKVLTAALGSHAQNENELLFSSIEAHLGPIRPLKVMRMEHDQIEGLLAEVQRLDEAADARQALLQAIAIARPHFAKEEQVLFPLAAQRLPASELEALGAEWGARRDVTLALPS